MNLKDNSIGFNIISIPTTEQIIFTKDMYDYFYKFYTDLANDLFSDKSNKTKKIWVEHDIKGKNEILKYVGLSVENTDRIGKHFSDDEIGKFNGIIPTIPCKFIVDFAKKISDKFYEFGYFPTSKFDISFFKSQNLNIKDVFKLTNQIYSLPSKENGKFIIKSYDVYEFYGIKVINANNGLWYKVEPVLWEKRGEYFVSQKVLFELPLYIDEINDDNLLFENTFLKKYLNSYFSNELVQGMDFKFDIKKILTNLDDKIMFYITEKEKLEMIKQYILKNTNIENHNYKGLLKR